MTEIESLRERVAKAVGPDRELDHALHGIWNDVARKVTLTEAENAPGWDTPAVTASIDAALALVERKLPGKWPIILKQAARLGMRSERVRNSDLIRHYPVTLADLPPYVIAALLDVLIVAALSQE